MKHTGLSPPKCKCSVFDRYICITKRIFMKKKLFNRILISGVLFISLTNFQFKKKATDTFCETQRLGFDTVFNKEGIVGYYSKYKRWAIYTDVSFPNNIDSKIVGISCSIPLSLQIDGLNIKFSGVYKKFNRDEKILPRLGGEDLYFLYINKIEKK